MIRQTSIQNIFMTFVHATHETLFKGMITSLPSIEKNKCSLPDSFGDFSNCRIKIDCTEFRINVQRKNLAAAASSFSTYKHYSTGKLLIDVAPNGPVTFVSNGFPRSTREKAVTKDSGILHHLHVCFIQLKLQYSRTSPNLKQDTKSMMPNFKYICKLRISCLELPFAPQCH